MRRATLIVSMVLGLVVAGSPAYSVPQLLQYQGRLTDSAGEPLAEPVDVTFTIYDASEGGAPLWTQTFESLVLDNGRFSVLLGGDEAPFTAELEAALEEGEDLFLGLKVGDDAEMSPRQQIASVAYALRADAAETAQTAETVAGMPGIAFEAVHRELVDPGESVSVVSVTLTTAVPGFVLVSGSGTLRLDNTSGSGALSHVNVGETADAMPDTAMGLVIAQIDSTATLARHYVPFHSQRVFEKPAGTYEFHLNVRNNLGDGQVLANRPSITATFFPVNLSNGGEEALRRSASRRR